MRRTMFCRAPVPHCLKIRGSMHVTNCILQVLICLNQINVDEVFFAKIKPLLGSQKQTFFWGCFGVFFYGSICPESFDWSWDVMGLKMKSLVL